MTKKTFAVGYDSENNKYVHTELTESTKNHQGGHKQNEQGYSNVRMYGPGVDIYEFYLSRLSDNCERLFQTPIQNFTLKGKWYKNVPMGKNTLGTLMQCISKKSGLSCTYTCHSVRASTITTLFQAGVSPQSIISITKHKNTSSLTHYIEDLSTDQKKDCCATLTSALDFSEKVCVLYQ